jgi:hypothetical protein
MHEMSDGPRVCHRTFPVTCRCHPVPRVTLTVVTRVTHRLVQLYTHTPHHPAMCHFQELPRQLYGRTACTISMPCGTVRTIQSSPFFAYLGFQTERDIFRIRSPFDELNIWTESGRRDRRNVTGFVRFQELSFLILFEPCQAFRSDYGSTPEFEVRLFLTATEEYAQGVQDLCDPCAK